MDADKFTGAWWREQFEGVCHRLNKQGSELVQNEKQFEAMNRRITELESERREMLAKIGELQERFDKMRTWLKEKMPAEKANGK